MRKLRLDSRTEVTYLPGSQFEVRFIFKEIFQEGTYFRHGIRVEDGSTVVDVGANIGLFALKVLRSARRVRYFGFEPVPSTFECLAENLKSYLVSPDIQIFSEGLSDRPGKSEILFLERAPGNATLYPDEKREEMLLLGREMRLREVWKWNRPFVPLYLLTHPFRHWFFQKMFQDFWRHSRNLTILLTTLDEFIRRSGLQQIDLLKIDVEGSEFDVLAGISDDNLRRVLQIVMEVAPARKDLIPVFRRRLEGLGFKRIALESMSAGSDPLSDHWSCNLYASRI